jgi:hypothetical protein
MGRFTLRQLAVVALLLIVAFMLLGCSTLHRYGVGGVPLLMCRGGEAFIDDKLAGADAARLSAVRRFKDADGICQKK